VKSSSGGGPFLERESRVEGYAEREEVTPMGKRGRDAKNGQFIPVKEAERRPSTTVVETTPKKK
jgi:hypothetical protein